MVVVSAPKSNSRRLPNSGIASSSSSNTCTALNISFSKTSTDIEDNYLNKWDNPLFSPTAEETECIEISRREEEDNAFGFKKLLADRCVLGVTSCDASQDEVGTSLLRLDMGGRNPQPPSPMQYHTSQSQDYYKRSLSSTTLSKFINANKQKKGSVVSSDSEESNQICTSQRWSNRHPVSDTMDGSNSARHRGNWDDRFSTCYFSGAEEKTIKTVSEHMKSDHATRHVDTDSGNETVGYEVWRANAEIQNAFQDVLYNQVDGTHNFNASDSATNSNCGGCSEYDLAAPSTQRSRTSHFSFTHELTSAARVHPGIKSYTEMFKREIQKDGGDCKFVRLDHYDEHSYELQLQAEALLFERVLLRNRIRSGVLLLCDPRL